MKKLLNYLKDYGGVGFGCAVFAVFFVLKVTDIIDWSWWWVVTPLWIPLVVDILLSVVYVVYNVYLAKERNKESK